MECLICKRGTHRMCVESLGKAEAWVEEEEHGWIQDVFGTPLEDMTKTYYQKNAEEGDTNAMHALGLICIRDGDIGRARRWLNK